MKELKKTSEMETYYGPSTSAGFTTPLLKQTSLYREARVCGRHAYISHRLLSVAWVNLVLTQ
jgi:hypothetical protein